MPHYERSMAAKFPGTCTACGRGIAAGSLIVWTKRPGSKGKARHADCATTAGDARTNERHGDQSGEIAETTQDERQHERRQLDDAREREQSQSSLDAAMEQVVRRVLDRDGICHAIEQAQIAANARAAEAQVVEHVHVVRYIERDGTETTVEGSHPQFAALARFAEAGENVYAWGAPGAGKSYAARELASMRKVGFRYVSLSPQSMPSLLLGYMDANGRYVRTAFRECYEHGGVFCIDEVDNANENLLASLNSALANGHCEFPDTTIARHVDCRIVATGNTPGFGPTLAFPSRRPLDRAFRDRFVFLRWSYSLDHERDIARSITEQEPLANAWCAWVHRVREYAATAYPALTCSPRSIYSGIRLLLAGDSAHDVAEAALFQGIEQGVVAKILAACPLPTIETVQAHVEQLS